MDEMQLHNECTAKFIELANEMKDDEIDIRVVSAALMAASGIYATYMAAGNAGALEPTGVDKVVAVYRQTLEHIQKRKKEEIQSGGA
ncbi:MAG: DUF3144 domain-containing protein [Xanthomonadales bacterium]|jgi:hypothetical protein|nr:DUF3144 domain-containing protein [Xanthomonadales bacterium]